MSEKGKAHYALGLGEIKKKEGAEREALLLEVKRLYVSKRLSFRWTVVWSVDGWFFGLFIFPKQAESFTSMLLSAK